MKLQNLIHIAIGIVCIGLLPRAQGVVPAPDGGYPGQNTAEGTDALFALTSGGFNTAVGFSSLRNLTTGSFNTAVGAGALLSNAADENTATGAFALLSNTTGAGNTANGTSALLTNTTGDSNTAIGADALLANTDGHDNTATGVNALSGNTTGDFNTATGSHALLSNTTGASNTADGFLTLRNNTTGASNTAIGRTALLNNTTGSSNTATGVNALLSNTIGLNNTASGVSALFSNTTGADNTAIGLVALQLNTSGFQNTATGSRALQNNTTGGTQNTATGFGALSGNTSGFSNTAIGVNALDSSTTGAHNVALGKDAGHLITGNFNIDINNEGLATDNRTIRIGRGDQTRTFIAGITGVAVIGSPVQINASGQLGVNVSSGRFKQNIQTMGDASDVLLALRPVTFRYKKEIDPQGIPQFGLVAEEVERVNPDLVARDDQGKAYTVRYDQVNAMLLNEFLKEHRKNEEQEATIADLKSGMKALSAIVNEQASQIQKVSAQLAAASPSDAGLEGSKFATGRIRIGKAAPQVVNNP